MLQGSCLWVHCFLFVDISLRTVFQSRYQGSRRQKTDNILVIHKEPQQAYCIFIYITVSRPIKEGQIHNSKTVLVLNRQSDKRSKPSQVYISKKEMLPKGLQTQLILLLLQVKKKASCKNQSHFRDTQVAHTKIANTHVCPHKNNREKKCVHLIINTTSSIILHGVIGITLSGVQHGFACSRMRSCPHYHGCIT